MRRFIIVILNMVALLAAQPCFSQIWLPVGQGVDCNDGAYIWDINISEDNTKLYIAGKINKDGDCNPMRATLSWDGASYSPTALSITGGESSIVFDFQGKTYCSGYLTQQSHDFHVKDEEGNWTVIPNGFGGVAMDYVIRDNIVYIAGNIPYCGGVPCGLVCTFDGEQVLPYHHVSQPYAQYALGVTFYEDTLYVSGTINSHIAAEAYNGYSNLLKVVDGQLQKVAQGFALQGMGAAVEVLDNKLYVGGSLKAMDDEEYHTIYYYQNGQLHKLPEEPNDLIFAMTTYQGALYVAGGFTQIGNMPCNNVARWDGQEWTCLTNEPFERLLTDGVDTVIYFCSGQCIKDIAVWNDTLYIAGAFNRYGETVTKRIAKLDMALSEAFPVNITEPQKQEVKMSVYPNPANDKLNIQLDKPSVVSVYTATGQLLETYTSKSTYQIDVSRYPAGLYLVVSGGVSKRFVRE